MLNVLMEKIDNSSIQTDSADTVESRPMRLAEYMGFEYVPFSSRGKEYQIFALALRNEDSQKIEHFFLSRPGAEQLLRQLQKSLLHWTIQPLEEDTLTKDWKVLDSLAHEENRKKLQQEALRQRDQFLELLDQLGVIAPRTLFDKPPK